ncbi:SMP-30/gluconolactonase/LRE family protein [Spirosoma utsteinense]|uniref:Sugar lactone lactonase YvrE n=1 Tax=Spirosoma utsteinense TaxID=2585773 RepID=A0ABR6WC27_9BACT|nr:SMP-30/gluconolactonase/LRE family protein [Spirosoma utsteinense]MBC3784045.1 sugar lactone lactonase YvrE [Spirosoma utsteinense]MBC3793466.1 sugar lactone lactonase YvrE [Spirosoma utsteinense]
MKKRWISGPLLAAAACWLTACEDHRNSPNAPFPERIEFVAERQYPEGIAYSSQLGKFVITSITQGKIGTVDTDGRYEDLLTAPELISGIGVKVVDGRIFVCVGDQGVSVKSTPQSAFKTAELLVFNSATRQLERRVDLDNLLPDARHFANDLAILPDGTIYVTDSFSPVIYKITPDGQASILVNDPRFASATFGLNGIVFHPDGYLIVAQTGAGKLYKVDLQNGNTISEVGNLASLPGDGLTLVNKTDLYVVTGSGSRVAQVRSSDDWQTASVVKTDENGYFQATTSVYVNQQIYTLNARIGEIGAAVAAMNPNQLQSRDYSIQRFR